MILHLRNVIGIFLNDMGESWGYQSLTGSGDISLRKKDGVADRFSDLRTCRRDKP